MFTYTGTFSQYTRVHIRVVYVCMDMYVGIYGMWVGRYVYVYTLLGLLLRSLASARAARIECYRTRVCIVVCW